jgi:hypothetical protein
MWEVGKLRKGIKKEERTFASIPSPVEKCEFGFYAVKACTFIALY